MLDEIDDNLNIVLFFCFFSGNFAFGTLFSRIYFLFIFFEFVFWQICFFFVIFSWWNFFVRKFLFVKNFIYENFLSENFFSLYFFFAVNDFFLKTVNITWMHLMFKVIIWSLFGNIFMKLLWSFLVNNF